MKKILTLLFILSVNPLFAQNFFVGGSLIGLEYYDLRQQPMYNTCNIPISISGQYIFKNSKIGVEADALNYSNSLPFSLGGAFTWNFTTIAYFVYSPLKKTDNVILQFKAGFFYSHFTTYYIPFDDIGPALGADFLIPISKKIYVGFDLSEMIGTNANYDPYLFDYQHMYFTQISYTCYLIKFIIKL